MGPILRPFYVMAKPVCGRCNLDCAYCYYTGKMDELYPGQSGFLMSPRTLEAYTRQYLQAMPVQATFGWQGGEPLLAGLEFFRQAVQLQRQYARTPPQVVANAMQTNGTLLDDAWCAFLGENRFLVGISLDGPPEWHDFFRRDRAGSPSFHRAWAGLELLRKHQVEFNVLVTLNRRNAPHAGDIYRYFVNRGVRWLQFIPVLETDAAGQPKEFSCTAEQFGRFMIEVFELWRGRHAGSVSERLIDSVLHTLVHGAAPLCCNAQRCANAFVLEWNGDLYACDHFVHRQWLIGNIHHSPLEALAGSPMVERFAELKTSLPAACRNCQYLPVCRGGCPKHHLPTAEALSPQRLNHFCQGYKMFFAHALPELKRLAERLARGEIPAAEPAGASAPATSPGRAASPLEACPSGGTPAAGGQYHPAVRSGHVGRNDPCPCGSGRKFKQCCGRR